MQRLSRRSQEGRRQGEGLIFRSDVRQVAGGGVAGAALSGAVEVGLSGFSSAHQQRSFRQPGAADFLDPRVQKRCDIRNLFRRQGRERGHAEGWPALLKEGTERISIMVLKNERTAQQVGRLFRSRSQRSMTKRTTGREVA